MHTIRFKLETTSYDEQTMEKRFHALSHVHNVMVKHAKKRLKKLQFHAEYQEWKKQYIVLCKKQELSPLIRSRKNSCLLQ